jgi:hypothetical protein
MESPRQLIALWAVAVAAWNPVAHASDDPPPRPTPRPGTLAALARSTELRRSPGADGAAPIVITDDNLASLGGEAVFTVLTTTAAEFQPLQLDDPVDPATRASWRKKVHAQSRAIAKLEARRSAIEVEIDRLERGRLDARTLDRIERAEAKLQAVDHDLKREKANLSKLIRAARREGAQPGWFR